MPVKSKDVVSVLRTVIHIGNDRLLLRLTPNPSREENAHSKNESKIRTEQKHVGEFTQL